MESRQYCSEQEEIKFKSSWEQYHVVIHMFSNLAWLSKMVSVGNGAKSDDQSLTLGIHMVERQNKFL